MPFIAEGVIPATLVAFHQDYEIDVEASRKHLRCLLYTSPSPRDA